MSNKQPLQRRGLGRGLGSLIPTAPPEQAGARAEEMGSFPDSGASQGRHSADAAESNGAESQVVAWPP